MNERMPARVSPGQRGFTMIEMVIAMAIMLVVIGGVFSIVDPGQGMSRTQPEVADMQERMRVAADTLQKDLIMAGAGTYSGAIAGTLANFFPPILPYRAGSVDADPEVSYFDDRITIMYVPDTASQTKVATTMPQPSSEIKVTAEPGCPTDNQLCGFSVGMRVVIFDDTGSYDVFTITAVQEDSLHLQHRPPNPDFSKAYSPSQNARIAQVDNHVYWLDASGSQLVHYDGFLTDVPVVDNTVGLKFTYYGDPNPPLAPKPVLGTANCIFDTSGNSLLPTLASNGSSLVELTAAMLTDGPVCGAEPNRFDADLFRIRKVKVELRVQASKSDMRAKTPTTLFTKPGTSVRATSLVPDYAMTFEVTPRNLNLIR